MESGQRSAERNVDIPVPGFRSRHARRTGEQNVDIPVPRSRAHGPNDDLPVPGPRLSRGFPQDRVCSAQWSRSSIFPFLVGVMGEVFLVFTFNNVPRLVPELMLFG